MDFARDFATLGWENDFQRGRHQPGTHFCTWIVSRKWALAGSALKLHI